jgi:hypothetical protein
MNIITPEQAAELYRYCILEDEFDFDAAAPIESLRHLHAVSPRLCHRVA